MQLEKRRDYIFQSLFLLNIISSIQEPESLLIKILLVTECYARPQLAKVRTVLQWTRTCILVKPLI